MLRSLVGSEMCIRDSPNPNHPDNPNPDPNKPRAHAHAVVGDTVGAKREKSAQFLDRVRRWQVARNSQLALRNMVAGWRAGTWFDLGRLAVWHRMVDQSGELNHQLTQLKQQLDNERSLTSELKLAKALSKRQLRQHAFHVHPVPSGAFHVHGAGSNAKMQGRVQELKQLRDADRQLALHAPNLVYELEDGGCRAIEQAGYEAADMAAVAVNWNRTSELLDQSAEPGVASRLEIMHRVLARDTAMAVPHYQDPSRERIQSYDNSYYDSYMT
eukprot:TRINITY_DN51230_c0_g1_i1.p1 TRINITY_DN51230_c0_g1~~TRINITY_DN51230_c0_g1_i1.p1  ORF type:complete len:271 (+),score=52.14 TRINITY_DN51230_c0_g1_i1:111-923(+)